VGQHASERGKRERVIVSTGGMDVSAGRIKIWLPLNGETKRRAGENLSGKEGVSRGGIPMRRLSVARKRGSRVKMLHGVLTPSGMVKGDRRLLQGLETRRNHHCFGAPKKNYKNVRKAQT